MIDFIKTVNRRIVADSIRSFYWDEQYELVLKYITGPSSNEGFHSVCIDIFRIFSLKNTNNEKWLSEYGYFLDKEKLKIFSNDDRNYIRLFMLIYLSGNVDIVPTPQINLRHISKKTLKYLPLSKWDDDFKHLIIER